MTRRLVSLLALVCLGAACSISPDASPNDISGERSNVFGDPATGDEAAGSNRIYLLSAAEPDETQNLRSVLRDVSQSAEEVLGSLFAGPNAEEREEQLDTAIPPDSLVAARTVGQIVTVDVTDAFNELTPDGLRLAVAQIVATASEIDGAAAVELRIDGVQRAWPLGDGELVSRPLTLYDYPGLVESSQPPFPAIPTAEV